MMLDKKGLSEMEFVLIYGLNTKHKKQNNFHIIWQKLHNWPINVLT
jgi:hypothetical protein